MALQDDFEVYHRDNPGIYDLFCKFALQLIQAGRTRASARAIYERIRWETSLSATGDEFKINDRYYSRYARKFVSDFPEHRGLFSFRTLRS